MEATDVSMNIWMGTEDMVSSLSHTHSVILLSHKMNEIMPFATTWMYLEGIMLNEVSDRQILYNVTYLESKK